MRSIFLALMISKAGFAGQEVPVLYAPGGAWWQPKTTLRLTRKLVLSTPTRLDADEIILEYPIVTNGYRLDINARRIIFGENGRIDAFETAAPAGVNGPDQPSPAKGAEKESAAGSNGENGFPGNRGADGVGSDGHEIPGEIYVFSAQLAGNPIVTGQGQAGGTGGRGGTGQQGGDGGKGKDAHAHDPCWFGESWDGGNGGVGGGFGKGGPGGPGGRGGAPVPVTVLSAVAAEPDQFRQITSGPGYGGGGGTPGEAGAPGLGGAGGKGDSNSCWFFGIIHNNKVSGKEGSVGPKCACEPNDTACIERECTIGHGPAGTVGTPIETALLESKIGRGDFSYTKVYHQYERKRLEVMLSWYDFHWRRSFEDLVQGSMLLLDDLEVSDPEAKSKNNSTVSLDGAIQTQIAETVSSEWKTGFLAPLVQQEVKYSSDPRILERLRWAREKALEFTSILNNVRNEGTTSPRIAEKLSGLAKSIAEGRSEILQGIAGECTRYTHDVLLDAEYKTKLRGSQYHYEIPACGEIASFSASAEGSMRRIELVKEITPYVSEGSKDSVSFETTPIAQELSASVLKRFTDRFLDALAFFTGFPLNALALDKPLKSHFTFLESRRISRETIAFAYPELRNAARLGELGVHRGFVSLPAEHQVKDHHSLRLQLYVLSHYVGNGK